MQVLLRSFYVLLGLAPKKRNRRRDAIRCKQSYGLPHRYRIIKTNNLAFKVRQGRYYRTRCKTDRRKMIQQYESYFSLIREMNKVQGFVLVSDDASTPSSRSVTFSAIAMTSWSVQTSTPCARSCLLNR